MDLLQKTDFAAGDFDLPSTAAGAGQAKLKPSPATLVASIGAATTNPLQAAIDARAVLVAQSALNAIPPDDSFEAASQSAMLAYGAKDGSTCIRTDLGGQWWECIALPSNNIANWRESPIPHIAIPIATLAEVQAGAAGQLVEAANAKATYLSKTDTAAQTVNSDLIVAPGKTLIFGLGGRGWYIIDVAVDMDTPRMSGLYYVQIGVAVANAPPSCSAGGFWFEEKNIGQVDRRTQISYGSMALQNAPITKRQLPWNTVFTVWDAWQPLGGASLGVSQTYQDVTASRAAGVTYTNNTGAPISVSVFGSDNPLQPFDFIGEVFEGGVWKLVSKQYGTTTGHLGEKTFIVQNGNQYRCTWNAAAVMTLWQELR
jgi:hypothetical protein